MGLKKTTATLLAAGLCSGVVLSAVAGIGVTRIAGYRLINEKQYGQYEQFVEDYGFLDALKKLVEEEYYIPVENEENLTVGMYKGLVSGIGDPYSAYLTEAELDAAIDSVKGSYGGVGVTMSVTDEDFIEVVSVTDDAPAEKAGIRAGDLIIGVDGVAYTGSQLSQAADKMRGEKGTQVTLTILRGDAMQNYTLTRTMLTDTTVYSKIIEPNLGYLRIKGFEVETGKQFAAELAKMKTAGVEGLIIDLRNNGGGVVDSAVEVADALLDAATVVYAENRKQERIYYKTENGKTDLPYVLLVDGGTASAAEILAAGVQDNDGGLIIGSQTYGKGIIQTTQRLINGDGLKLTTMQYFSAKGNAIHGIGITPDVVVDLTIDDVDEDGVLHDRQMEKAIEFFRKVQ